MTPGASKVAVARSERIREQENNEGTGCSSRHREQPGHTHRGVGVQQVFYWGLELKTQFVLVF